MDWQQGLRMTEEHQPEQAKSKFHEVGATPVSPVGIIVLIAYLVAISSFLLYSLLQLWPSSPSAGEQVSTSMTIFSWTFSISEEVRLMLIAMLAGALGSLVHALRSLYWYVGNRTLVRSWLAMYVLLPFVGATLALIFYFVIRGGFSRHKRLSKTRARTASQR